MVLRGRRLGSLFDATTASAAGMMVAMANDPDDDLLEELVRRMSQPSGMSRRQQRDFLRSPLIRGLARLTGQDMEELQHL